MKKIVLCSTSRNHLRFLIPLIENLCKRSIVLLYCNASEISNDSLAYKLQQLQSIYKTLMILDLSQRDLFQNFVEGANSLLVTTGTSNQCHRFEYELCKSINCKTFAIQHGISQEGITRLPHYYFSADKVITWIKEEYLHPNVATPKDKFIFVGVPNHHFEKISSIKGAKVFFFTNYFDKPNNEDLKLESSCHEWGGIYTTKWKEETWDKIISLSDGPCFFVRHPTRNGGNLHPKLNFILKKEDKHLVDNAWLSKNGVNRSQLYSLGSKYYVTNPSSCWIDCYLNGVDYEVFVDYNSKVDVLLEDSLQGVNKTAEICELLLQD